MVLNLIRLFFLNICSTYKINLSIRVPIFLTVIVSVLVLLLKHIEILYSMEWDLFLRHNLY